MHGNVPLWPSLLPSWALRRAQAPRVPEVGPGPSFVFSHVVCPPRTSGLPDAGSRQHRGPREGPTPGVLCRAQSRASLATGTSHPSLSPPRKPQKAKSEPCRAPFPFHTGKGLARLKTTRARAPCLRSQTFCLHVCSHKCHVCVVSVLSGLIWERNVGWELDRSPRPRLLIPAPLVHREPLRRQPDAPPGRVQGAAPRIPRPGTDEPLPPGPPTSPRVSPPPWLALNAITRLPLAAAGVIFPLV